MTKVSKQDIINAVAATLDITKSQAKDAVDATLNSISAALEHPDTTLQLRGFGVFSTKMTNERQGRNPATGESLTIPAKLATRFKRY